MQEGVDVSGGNLCQINRCHHPVDPGRQTLIVLAG
jgi:hypothetical protein